MAQLQWKDTPDQTPTLKQSRSHQSNESNPWFATTMGLAGIIIGYLIGIF